jgi:hypothetical protein
LLSFALQEFVHCPPEHVWPDWQSLFFCVASDGTQLEFAVPGFWQMYVLKVWKMLLAWLDWQKGEPI